MAPRRLYRSTRERILGGVAAGIADYFDVDPTLVRLAWILFALAGGSGVIAYIIAWIIIPEEPSLPRGGSQREPAWPGEGGPAEPGRAASEPQRAAVERGEASAEAVHRAARGDNSGVFGLVLIGLGVILLARNVWPVVAFILQPWNIGGLVLVALGLFLILRGLGQGGRRRP
ncbi:MAG: PspC domain-containing protein [Firmicutes bacterium]|nr:PspC domain-containing protein [Bacillota bacterium]